MEISIPPIQLVLIQMVIFLLAIMEIKQSDYGMLKLVNVLKL